MMRIKFSDEFKEYPALIKIVGVGGAGGNAVNRMAEVGIKGVELISINTDVQDLRKSSAHIKLQIGTNLTSGLGAGGKPDYGKKAAQEDKEKIEGEIKGADMVFVTAGMGGGTGTGAAPIVAEIARSYNALTVGIVTFPFEMEGKKRSQNAEIGVKDLKQFVDTLLIIQNDKLFELGGRDISWTEGIRMADDVLRQAVQAITDVITTTGTINVDFADVREIMTGSGEAHMGIGEAEGENRAINAVQQAISSPLLENVSIEGAKGVILNITSGHNFKLHEAEETLGVVHGMLSDEGHVYYGHVIDETFENKIKVTIIATGFLQKRKIQPATLTEKNRKKWEKFGQEVKKTYYSEVEGDSFQKPSYLRQKSRKLI